MEISSLFKKDKAVLSFEVFPPKKTSSIDTIYNTLGELKDLSPDFISVTYGAGGSAANLITSEIASLIKHEYKIETMAHLTCVNSSKKDIDEQLAIFKQKDITNILALRGDINPDLEPKKDFLYASDLVSYIKAKGDFHVSGACYPEGHVETEDIVSDIHNLKLKVDAGATHLVSQLFFDNQKFYDFKEKTMLAGINVPIQAGIMPVVSKTQIERMVSLCGASLPSTFTKMMQKYDNKPEALKEAGIAYAISQIIDLLSNGVDGIHLYTMNNPVVAKKITDSIKNLL